MKKGFTLIELLAVVLILGIILLIAIPSIIKYLNKGSNTYYANLEDNIILAGRDYLNDYRTLYPKEIGNVTVIELSELVNNRYLEEVTDTNGKTCEGKMIAKKIAKNNYEYYSCLICEEYKTKGTNCEYSEDNNITAETKNYKVEIEQISYTINQGEKFDLPKAKAYYLGQLVDSNVIGSPKIIDTNKLGTTTVTYAYKGAKKTITVTVVDNVKPSMPQVALRNDNASGNKYNGNWYSGNIYVELKATDYTKNNLVGSGISYYEISKDEENWQKLTGNTTTISDLGDTTYYVRSIDKAGNISENNTFNVKIDKETFECVIEASGTKGKNDWYTSDVELQVKALNEPTSGISAKGLNKTNVTTNTTGDTIIGTITSGSGKIATCTKTIKVDKATLSKPTIKASDNITSGNWHNDNVTLTASGVSSTSGITYYMDTNTNPVTSTSSVTASNNTTSTGINYYAKACNGAGTCSQVNNYLLKIDKSTPSCTIVASGTEGNNGWYISDVTLSLDITETPSSISQQNISANKITTNTTGQTVTGTITSGAGAVATCSKIVRVDKEQPTTPVIKLDKSISSTTITASLDTLSTATSSIDYYEYWAGLGTPDNRYTTNVTGTTKTGDVTLTSDDNKDAYGNIHYRAVSKSGLISDWSNGPTYTIDKVKPTLRSVTGTGPTVTENKEITVEYSSTITGEPTVCYYVSDTTTLSSNVEPIECVKGMPVKFNVETIGTYIFFRATNGAGLSSDITEAYPLYVSKNVCEYEIGHTWTFDYNGNPEEFIVPCDGTYKLEVWGAQGGTYQTNTGGLGGYSYGNKVLREETPLYVVVGGQGGTTGTAGYNGGGTGTDGNIKIAGGGGATHMALAGDVLKNVDVSKLLIVAGGGSGGWHSSSYSKWVKGQPGGGLTGGGGSSGGTQTAGGYNPGTPEETHGGYGYGANFYSVLGHGYGGGGGGYYGGAGGGAYYSGGIIEKASGGGSGYIDGVTDGTTESGIREGEGYAKITLVSLTYNEDYEAVLACSNGRTLTPDGNCTYYYTENEEKCGAEQYTCDTCLAMNYYWDFTCENGQTCTSTNQTGLISYCCQSIDGSLGTNTKYWGACASHGIGTCTKPKSCTIIENEYLIYTCPDGGILNSNTKMCEF